jgi:uncharacterized protein YdeI (YjbR/CyaY-like superfamily)
MAEPANKDFRHPIPPDLQAVLQGDRSLQEKWDGLTPLARNEWVCWMTSAKQAATRAKRLGRLQEDLMAGKRRPCCWPGCSHRSEAARKWIEA